MTKQRKQRRTAAWPGDPLVHVAAAADCDARMAVLDGAAELARWQPVLDRLPGLATIIVLDPSACPAGGRYLTWDRLVAMGRDRLAADPGEITARVAAIRPSDPLALL